MALPEPSYIERDAAVVLQECVARYEQLSGQELTPAHVHRLAIDILVYREMVLRVGIQEAAKQNTWRYSRYPMIDLLAEILGPAAARLAPRSAVTTLRYTIAAQLIDTPIPAGTRVRTNDNAIVFETVADTAIVASSTTVDVLARAQVVGVTGNGYAPGQITTLVDELDVEATVTNLTESNDGAAEEETEAMRARLPDAIATQATAGPGDAYRAYAMSVSQNIIDVAVTETQLVPCTCEGTPPIVKLTVLTKTGTASPELLAAVLAQVNGAKVRPLTDRVDAEGADDQVYVIDVSLVLYASEDEDEAIALATAALNAYALERRSGLGRAPANGPIIAAIKTAVPHVFDVIVNEPSPPPAISATQYALCTSVTVDVDSHVTERRPVSA